MLSRHLARAQRTLQLGDIEPEDRHAEGEGDGWEEIQVLGCFIEGWWVLEDTEAAGSKGHYVEPLPAIVSQRIVALT